MASIWLGVVVRVGGLKTPTGARLTEGPGLPPSGLSCEAGFSANDEMPESPSGRDINRLRSAAPGGPPVSTEGPWAMSEAERLAPNKVARRLDFKK